MAQFLKRQPAAQDKYKNQHPILVDFHLMLPFNWKKTFNFTNQKQTKLPSYWLTISKDLYDNQLGASFQFQMRMVFDLLNN